jgi:GlcNAc-P-P-Und epimerase
MSPRILVTGGSGFIGTNLVAHYLARSQPVLNLDRLPPRCPAHLGVWRRADLLDLPNLRAEITRFSPTHIFHLAARTDLDGRSNADYAANTDGVMNLLTVVEGQQAVARVIFASSRLVCRIGYQPRGDDDYCPTTAYGESKVAGERLVRQWAAGAPCDWLIVRPTSIWGPWFDVPYRNFFDAVRAGRYLHPRGRVIRKSFGYVGNTVHQLDRLMFGPADRLRGRTLYLCDYEPLEIRGWAEQVREACAAPPVRDVPVPLLKLAARVGDALHAVGVRQPPLTSFRLANLLTEMVHDTTELQQVCGELPHSVAAGVEQTVRWLGASR